ncbi:odorant receptor [Solea senegalensis]|uniref:Odorant receptor n=1 Tax=Solea senegalensis TaxID=28829 RepID=A0AAV6Q2U4_SOLSE|nr:olfactory receptor 52D1 [Solea senegalensis]KAG7480290.1 odorant receptor [Solea senegalensis]
MNNSVNLLQITFTIYSSLGVYNVALVVFVFVFYVSSVCINVFLVMVICMDPRLYGRPMYVLLMNLCLCGMVGTTSVCLSIIKHVLHHNQQMSLQACLTQIFFNGMYSTCIFCILALMAYDRYVSICKPLLYHTIMTPLRVNLMLLVVYMVLSSFAGMQMYLTSRLQLCGHTVDRLVCYSMAIAYLSCKNSTVIYVYGLTCACFFIMLPSCLVILSYVHIFMVIVKKSKDSQRKALQTCTPHLVTFINFSVASLFGVIYNRLSRDLPKVVTIFITVNFFIIPPLLHPIIYGIKMQEIRQSISKRLKDKKRNCNFN